MNIKKQALFLAPMEGITDGPFREKINELYPSWDYMACDFFRVPSSFGYPKRKLVSHFGDNIYQDPKLMSKNYFQILAASNSKIEYVLEHLSDLKFPWIDLNLGCPSKTVTGHQGGSYLLGDLPLLKRIVSTVRQNYKGHFTAKIRIGVKCDSNFESILKILQDEGVEAITIHARTREQMYTGRANWDYIKKAVKLSQIPIIGNGDIWTLEDLENIFDYTGCHAVMCARGALKTPWLSDLAQTYAGRLLQISGDREFMLEIRAQEIPKYLNAMKNKFAQIYSHETVILKRLKSISRFLFDDFNDGQLLRSKFMRSRNLTEFMQITDSFSLS